MKIFLLFVTCCLLVACQSAPCLEEGQWTGSLTPMNHPDMSNPIAYQVAHADGQLRINIIGPDGSPVPARDIRLEKDTLFFTFNEPEEQVPLDCALGENESGSYSGRCTDASGKWAAFSMTPPRK